MAEEVIEVVGRIQEVLADLCEVGATFYASIDEDEVSPYRHRQLMLDCHKFKLFEKLVNTLLQQVVKAHYNVEVIPSEEIVITLERELQALTEFSNKYRTRYDSCQVRHSRVEQENVSHCGTGYRQNRSFGSSESTCDGPLRTEEEIVLGMCGSCLKRYDSRIGKL